MERQTVCLFVKNQDFQNKLSGSFEVQAKKNPTKKPRNLISFNALKQCHYNEI